MGYCVSISSLEQGPTQIRRQSRPHSLACHVGRAANRAGRLHPGWHNALCSNPRAFQPSPRSAGQAFWARLPASFAVPPGSGLGEAEATAVGTSSRGSPVPRAPCQSSS